MKPSNNIGFLRLFFASCVIIGHAPELADGNRNREPLTCIFHTLSLGELSVDAFFLLSGYLIAASMVNSHSTTTYFRRRIVRIYPGYLAAFAIVIFVLGPCLGIKIEPALEIIFRTVLLLPPANSPQLAPLHYPNLDVAMWTISYEFRCYIFLALFNKFGLFHKRLMAVVVISLAATSFAATFNSIHEDLHRFGQNGLVWLILEDPAAALRFTSIFMIGSATFLYKTEITDWLTLKRVLICTLLAAILMFNLHTAELGLASFGSVTLFWLALKADLGPFQRINDNWDISYGTYLYGWPVETTVLWLNHNISPLLLVAISLPATYLFGIASWLLVERPAKKMWKAPLRLPAATVATAADDAS